MTWPPPTPDEQVRFLRNVQRLLAEGQFTASYKFALVHALADLAQRFATTELTERLGLGGVLGGGGGGDGEEGGEQGGGAKDDPAALLEQAQELWDAGEKAEAARLYQRLREEFKLSLVYLLNRDEIKDRAKWKPK